MIDSIGGFGPIKGVSPANKAQSSENKDRAEEAKEASATRKVELPKDVIDLSGAEKTVSEIRQFLENNPTESLGLDPNFDETV